MAFVGSSSPLVFIFNLSWGLRACFLKMFNSTLATLSPIRWRLSIESILRPPKDELPLIRARVVVVGRSSKSVERRCEMWNVTKSTLIFTTDWHIFQGNWIQFSLDWKVFMSRMFRLFMMGEWDVGNVIWEDEALSLSFGLMSWGVILCNFQNSKSCLVLLSSSSFLPFTNYLIFRRLVHTLESTMQNSNTWRQFSAIFLPFSAPACEENVE